MENINEINVKEALERLSYPSFFDDEQRIAAYFLVMEIGNPVQKVLAERAVARFPLEEFFAMRAKIR
jgi:hypothetical protein